ncbi:molybdopterin-binding protein [Undibacterium sp. RTI2.1]|uniref:molybdopterin molybdotransferase MoeA n=1 Tax=unclassified Undibacterium TaxID=2630295 RepID=UPI002AB5BA92|nr:MULTISPECIES: gephyrin-like molybdotransferase Glp [unclassified Undibacterium]MDY7537100.1 molybdopterin-binding protein [Undibacterium sp. 5I1]MEB0029861.1 molybdopterin-binding protein [Undibacterium sp. RTI2.1]MEB0115146.1 molybdopterin-binding protein [Undibacterium sp. RTI2.2]MEB0229278.1 molybdopterin-binding protein [Undibacterium sp. 10I3]MEB0256174.1 molybdopterin-binding protein [Undibacterium sp. 5I1]
MSANTPAANLHHLLSCLSDYDPNSLPVAQAQQIIQQFVTPIDSVEKLAIRQALGRVLAADVLSGINVPAYDNSAMDGYAFIGSDLQKKATDHSDTTNQTLTLKVVGAAYAGRAFEGAVQRGECIRIMTGAVMPSSCDTVIPQEWTVEISDSKQATESKQIRIPAAKINAGDNRRLKGEDLAIGTTALSKGKILRPADLGLLASLGVAEVAVQRRLRVAIFSTGDELRSRGETLDLGCVYDSNRYTLYGMLTRLGCEIIDMGVIKDDPISLEAAFRSAGENADAIITSGGVSVGAADYTKQMMEKLGDVAFWSIAMRPGRPMAFGKIQSNKSDQSEQTNGKGAYLFGLPGNPVAVMVSFYFFVRDALLQMMGAVAVSTSSSTSLPLVPAISSVALRKRAGRTEYQRGIVSVAANGQLQVSITGSQGSGILRSMSEANCMVVLHHDQADIAAGEKVDILLFEGLI